MSERSRIAALAALAVIPLVLLGLFTIRSISAEQEARIVEDRIVLVQAAARTVSSFVDGNLVTVMTLALVPSVTDPDRYTAADQVLTTIAAASPEWEGIGLVGPDGRPIAGGTDLDSEFFVGDQPYFQRTIATGSPAVGEPVLSQTRNAITIPVAARVEFADGQSGAIVVALSVAELVGQIERFSGQSGVRVVLVDGQGRVFVDPDSERARALGSLADVPEVREVLAGRTGARRGNGPGGEDRLVAYAPVMGYGWGVLAYQPTDLLLAPVQSAVQRQLALLIATMFVAAGFVVLFGGRLAASYAAIVAARRQAEEARAVAERAGQRAVFLAQLSQELASSPEFEQTVQNAARLAVPIIADWCAVDIVDDDGSIRRVAVAHVDPAKESLAQELQRSYPPKPDSAVPRVIRTGEPLLVDDISDSLLEAEVKDPDELAVLRTLHLSSLMVVPLIAQERVLGAMTFLAAESGMHYDDADLTFARDAAARAALALENARLYRDLEQAVRTRDEYLAAASHDLRNPLTAIRGSAQLLGHQLKRLDIPETEPLHTALGLIESATARMGRLVNGLLDLARLESGRPLELHRAPMDLVPLVQQVAAEIQQGVERETIRIEADPHVTGEWDAGRLERVIANLLDNAVKYGPERAEVAVIVRQEQRGDEGCAILEVRDHGVGIPPADLPFVFERFHRGSNVVGQIRGTGLGLAGARQIVEEHGGTISVSSELGRGTTVRVELPIDVPEVLPTPAPEVRAVS
jgi:signal transduction histidine kinase